MAAVLLAIAEEISVLKEFTNWGPIGVAFAFNALLVVWFLKYDVPSRDKAAREEREGSAAAAKKDRDQAMDAMKVMSDNFKQAVALLKDEMQAERQECQERHEETRADHQQIMAKVQDSIIAIRDVHTVVALERDKRDHRA